jgi:hypothetical protein
MRRSSQINSQPEPKLASSNAPNDHIAVQSENLAADRRRKIDRGMQVTSVLPGAASSSSVDVSALRPAMSVADNLN